MIEVGFRLAHFSDPHFGRHHKASVSQAFLQLAPDLDADAFVLSGDVTQRARDIEFEQARRFVEQLETYAPSIVVAGNHDVEWWARPLLPFSPDRKYRRFSRHFRAGLAPRLELDSGYVIGMNSAHGVAWASAAAGALHVSGFIPRGDIRRVAHELESLQHGLVRVVVFHHNPVAGEASGRVGLKRAGRVLHQLAAAGADLILCGHDHAPLVTDIDGCVVVSAGTLGGEERNGVLPGFTLTTVTEDRVHVELFEWDQSQTIFRRRAVTSVARRLVAKKT